MGSALPNDTEKTLHARRTSFNFDDEYLIFLKKNVDNLDKVWFGKLDDKYDYTAWRNRVLSLIGSKEFQDAINPKLDRTVKPEKKVHASNLITSALSGEALRVVRSNIGEPAQMLQKMDERYQPRSTGKQITKCPSWYLPAIPIYENICSLT